jgi:HD-GYP domain-containing protein (c-di-GMP phosphodiesterase class II)/HAMP domain-containing protein
MLGRLRSLRVQLALALGLFFILIAGAVGFTLYELNLRRHDYVILNLAGQLRVLSQHMVDQSRRYLTDKPDDHAKYERDLKLYYKELLSQQEHFEKIIKGFEDRRLDVELTGRSDPLTCSWDGPSRSQLGTTAAIWRGFRGGLRLALANDPDGPRLIAAAEYIVRDGDELIRATDALASAFQRMMEGKLDLIRLTQWATAGAGLVLLSLLLAALMRQVVRPLQATQHGFERVAQGDFAHRVAVPANHELGAMATSFNALAERINSLFRLNARINQGTSLDATLRFVREEFSRFLPVDWVGVLTPGATPGEWLLERFDTHLTTTAREGESHALPTPTGTPMLLDLAADAGFGRILREAGAGTAVAMPLQKVGDGDTPLLVFAAVDAAAYGPERIEFLANLAGQISPALDRTVVVETLVVAAVGGLAKLAESRDPETGDHLFRMARYSAIVAEELGRDGPYRERIDAAYVRAILQFAPMHDIGKVGIADHILLKPGKLDDAEFAEMQKHPLIGGEVLRRCEAQVNALGHSIFRIGAEIAESHHEKFDGGGYPHGLAGDAIPLSARIVAVADVFDALTSKRPYKEAWPVDQALDTLRRDADRHFDPAVVAAFERALPKIMAIYERHRHV